MQTQIVQITRENDYQGIANLTSDLQSYFDMGYAIQSVSGGPAGTVPGAPEGSGIVPYTEWRIVWLIVLVKE